ncbi:putative nuclease HARBI1 [Diachasma alloeum]|uniref:putative nuclease HARBI1 n=1 Tax=Diachasma alloeum TaxID=454923 RepID=UPI0007381329|nr:putative nuclease HARBI1 [Diachasma alloeum]
MNNVIGDLIGGAGRYRPIRRNAEPVNHFEILPEIQFRERYRLSKRAFLHVLRRIEHGLRRPLRRNHRITSSIQLLVALRFFATGSYLITVGDTMSISKSATWEIVHRVAPLIAALSPDYIKFPSTPEAQRQAQAELFARSAIPNAVGCVDGRQVRHQSYGGENGELYRNRHGWFSINVQGICNARLEFTNFVARWPGATHDTRVFRHSRICHLLYQGVYRDALLLGDSGYPDLPFLMTPLRNPQTAAEHLYNEAQIRTRNCIERCFEVWARRFTVVEIGSRFHTPERTVAVIIATAALHNISLWFRPFRRREVDVEAYNAIHENIALGHGNTIRQQLVTGYFEQLI